MSHYAVNSEGLGAPSTREAWHFAPVTGTTPHLAEAHDEFAGDSASYAIRPDQAMGASYF